MYSSQWQSPMISVFIGIAVSMAQERKSRRKSQAQMNEQELFNMFLEK